MNPLGTVASTPGALYLLGTSLIGRLPTAMAALAIVQLVRLQGGSYTLAGVLTAIYIVASAVGAPALGRWVDRRGQTGVLVVSAILSSAAFAAVALCAHSAPVIAVVGAVLAGLFTPPLEPSLRSLWPRIIPDGKPLKAAFSLDAGATELLFIAGPLLTVVGIWAFGATGNILFAAALGLVGTLGFASNRVSRAAGRSEHAGLRHVSPVRDARFRRLVAFTFGVGVPVGVLTIAVTVYGERNGIDSFAGWALAVNALGALAGATTLALRPLTRSPLRALAACGALLGLGYVPLAVGGLPPGAWLVCALVAGFMLPPTLAQVFESIEKISPAESLTEANAWIVSSMNVGVALGTLAAGAVANSPAATTVPLIVAGGILVTVLLSLVVLPERMSRLG
ncbi:MFS transporter [Glaciihabitans sp. dw_435]|uniref:MFS transporter n=1 Tax=Glaciihabitans sp. dw_435 TaxID=2720081 RepID=UPI001BD50F20|nr:MFS transporter [Glaciihabitans sp. dw_435]